MVWCTCGASVCCSSLFQAAGVIGHVGSRRKGGADTGRDVTAALTVNRDDGGLHIIGSTWCLSPPTPTVFDGMNLGRRAGVSLLTVESFVVQPRSFCVQYHRPYAELLYNRSSAVAEKRRHTECALVYLEIFGLEVYNRVHNLSSCVSVNARCNFVTDSCHHSDRRSCGSPHDANKITFAWISAQQQ